MKRFYHKVPPYFFSVIVLALLFYFTLTPQPVPQMELPDIGLDKIVHVIMMASVYITMAFDYLRQKRQQKLSLCGLLCLFVINLALGGAIELLQGTEVINRGCDLYDFLADATGSLIAAIVTPKLMRHLF